MTPFEVFRMPVSMQRKAPGSYVNGVWVEGALTTIPITASIQPTTGEELLSLPEGRRDRKTYALFTSTKLNVARPGINPDLVTIFGEVYEVIKVDIWQNRPAVFAIINHYKVIVSALEAII